MLETNKNGYKNTLDSLFCFVFTIIGTNSTNY